MDDDLRMKLADLGSPERLAECIITHFDLRPPIKLKPIAEAIGITKIIAQKTGQFEGVLITDSAKAVGEIAYNDASPTERTRFTVAHEMGHFLLPLHNKNVQCAKADMTVAAGKDPNRAREAEANRFAAALLMPRSMFIQSITRLGAPEVEHIVKLAESYEVSKEAAARRYTELTDSTCAIVFSREGKLRYFCKTSGFPFIDLNPGESLPHSSISSTAKADPGYISDWAETDLGEWTSNGIGRNKALQEQYLDQVNGYRVSMLSIDDVDDDGGEDEDLRERWTPKFRR